MKLASFLIGLFSRRERNAGLRRMSNLSLRPENAAPANQPQLQRRMTPPRPVFGTR